MESQHRFRGEGFTYFAMGLAFIVVIDEPKGSAAEDSQVGNDIGFATGGAVLIPESVASPVVSIFHPAPVTPDEIDPALVGMFVGLLTGKVVAGLERALSCPLVGATALNADAGASKGKVDGHGRDVAQDQAPFFDSPVADIGLEQRGADQRIADGHEPAAWLGCP